MGMWWVLRPAYSPCPTLHPSRDFEVAVIPVCSIGHGPQTGLQSSLSWKRLSILQRKVLSPGSWISAEMLRSQGHSGRGVERAPGSTHTPVCALPCRPPGHPVQSVLPSTTSTALLSRTCPSAKETCSPLWRSPRYRGPYMPSPFLHLQGFPLGLAPLQREADLRVSDCPLSRTQTGTKPKTKWAVRASSQPTMSRSVRA